MKKLTLPKAKSTCMKAQILSSLLTCTVLATAVAQQSNPRPPQPVPGGLPQAFGPGFSPRQLNQQRRPAPVAPSSIDTAIQRWNQIAIDASGLDHTPVAAGESRVYGEQLGPCRASRAIAIVHVAMFESVNSIYRRYRSYLGLLPVAAASSDRAAIAQAARDALVAMFPSQSDRFDAFLAEDLAALAAGRLKTNGIEAGQRAAAAILARRSNDGSAHSEPLLGVDYIPSAEPGMWRQDPISQARIALGGRWSTVQPFVMQSAVQFRLPAPPALNSFEHTAAFVEAKRLGGDVANTSTERDAEETKIGTFWAYDGTPSLCAPPRLYNQIARTVAQQQRTTGIELLRLLTVANVAMADTAIAAWDSKYFHGRGRPVTMIREAADDGNEDTVPDTTFHPLGAPASNLSGPNFTPPFPAYPSGHAAFGGALFQTLRRFYGRDNIAFTFVSDEYNGTTLDSEGNVRPLVPRSFQSLTDAEDENAASRIYLGIHWKYDATDGVDQGRNVGNWVFERLYAPPR